ncbi:hypothetical protein P43SY_001258 [Pythium insidiosum]|uniref:Uncharacterized protein n=1 Tax=Pythium insidiosum TaxID=114742 RepID=A0AAD5Q787_PYTIN|nr:hypothetical protein P43SY_001258 [Pythium insidiosum]
MDNISFKKKTKKKSAAVGARKRKLHDDADENETAAGGPESTDADTLQSIEEVLEEQRLRTQLLKEERMRGKLRSKAEKATPSSSGGSATDMQYGLHDPKKDGAAGEKLLTLLDGQFTGQTGASSKEQHEELMKKYIEERLRKRAKPESDDATPAPVTTDDVLFADLREQVMAPKEESTDGGVLIWNTGIAEVELPSSYQERTLAATKRALESAQQRSRSGVSVDSSALPTNFSTDFNRHRSEHVAEMKSLSKDEQRERGFVPAKKFQSNDDAAVARFRKMESRKRHR